MERLAVDSPTMYARNAQQNASNSPGMLFQDQDRTHRLSNGGGGGGGGGSGEQQQQRLPASKSPIYRAVVKDSLTPPSSLSKTKTINTSRQQQQHRSNNNISSYNKYDDDNNKYDDNNGRSESRSRSGSPPARSVAFDRSVPDSPPPPPPPPSNDNNNNNSNNRRNSSNGNSDRDDGTGAGGRPSGQGQGQGRNALNWGALKESLDTQERQQARGVQFSPDHLPPHAFALDESVATTQATAEARTNGKLGLGIEENARRVGSYMSKLEDYLQGNAVPAAERDSGNDVEFAELMQLPSYTGDGGGDGGAGRGKQSPGGLKSAAAAAADVSDSSMLSFNAQATAQYMQAKERHGLHSAMASAAYDSQDEDNEDDDDDDSLYGLEVSPSKPTSL